MSTQHDDEDHRNDSSGHEKDAAPLCHPHRPRVRRVVTEYDHHEETGTEEDPTMRGQEHDRPCDGSQHLLPGWDVWTVLPNCVYHGLARHARKRTDGIAAAATDPPTYPLADPWAHLRLGRRVLGRS